METKWKLCLGFLLLVGCSIPVHLYFTTSPKTQDHLLRTPPDDHLITEDASSLTNATTTIELEGLILDEAETLPPLIPLTLTDYLGFALVITGLMIAAGGGIGGGAILIPIYILVLDFPVKHAIALGSVTVLGGAIANNILNGSKRHPDHASRPLIDWELILQMEPMTMAGTLIGAQLNHVLPDALIVALLLALLSFTAYKTFKKANKLYAAETEMMTAEQQATSSSDEETTKLLNVNVETSPVDAFGNTTATNGYGTTDGEMEQNEIHHMNIKEDEDEDVEAEIHRQSRHCVLRLSGLFVAVTLLNLLKGGPKQGGGPVGVSHCGRGCFWMTEFTILVIIFVFAAHARSDLLHRIERGKAISSDIAWNDENTITYPALAITAGLAAGMFGIGGGIVKGPIMLALGVHPAVASATSAAMILFTSSTATVSYSVFGLLVYDYAVVCLLVGFGSTIAGQTVMTALVRRFKRNSLIAYCIGYVVAISAVCMAVEAISDL